MSIESDSRPDGEPARHPYAWLDDVVECSGTGDSVSRDEVTEAALERARGHARALAWLTRHSAPNILEGRVVASQNSGYRQDRAVAFVQELAVRQAPHELDALLHPAPRELDERVARAVEEPEAFAVAAMTARLGRMDAPAELDELVENAISPRRVGREHGVGVGSAGHSKSDSRRSSATGFPAISKGVATLALTLSLALLAIVGWPRSASSSSAPTGDRSIPAEQVSLEVVRITASDLSPSDKRAVLALGAPLVGGNS